MSAPSPTQLAGTLAAAVISAGGQPLDSTYQVISVEVWHGVNKMPRARLVISDGSPDQATFPISETRTLIPGVALTIALGYDGEQSEVFSGVIHQQGLQISRDGPSRLVVEATDPAMVMTLARKNAIFNQLSDSDLIKKLISGAGLGATVEATTAIQPSVVQFYCSDWDLMLMRAQLNGMVVAVAGGKVKVGVPDTAAAPVLALTYGSSILDFHADMDASTQYAVGAIQSVAWDAAAQALATSGKASTGVTAPGDLGFDDLAGVFGVKQHLQQTGATLDQAGLTAWSSAELTKNCLAKIRGEVRFQGCALAVPGAMVTLAGLGGRFNGNAYLSAVCHTFEQGWWTTSGTIGLSPDWFAASAPRIQAPPAAGQLPAATLQTGIVLKVDADPDGEFRVQLRLPLLQAGELGVWARLGSTYASTGVGAVFYPEVGDEVVVAFLNGDPRAPVIIGALYSKKHAPPAPPDARNSRKTIMTRAKLRVDFLDEEQAIEIATDQQQSIRIDDKNGTLVVKDKNGNSIKLGADGVLIDSAGKLAISAKGDLTLQAQGKLALNGGAGVTLAGASISAKADTSFAASGATEAKLTSSAMVTVKGAMVMIN